MSLIIIIIEDMNGSLHDNMIIIIIKLYNWKIYFCCIVMVLSTHGLRLGRSY